MVRILIRYLGLCSRVLRLILYSDLKLERLRYEVKKGAVQAEKGEFSSRSVKDIIADQEALQTS